MHTFRVNKPPNIYSGTFSPQNINIIEVTDLLLSDHVSTDRPLGISAIYLSIFSLIIGNNNAFNIIFNFLVLH